MFRFELARIADNTASVKTYIGMFVVHHIAFDYLSIELMIKEFAVLYGHFAQAGNATSLTAPNVQDLLPALPIQYADFATWQREWADSPDYARQKAYWLQQLSDAPARLDLPSDYLPASSGINGWGEANTNVSRHIGRRVGIELPVALSDALRQLAKSQGVTLYMPLLSVFNLLLNRYTQQDDICVGTSIANRTRKETEHLLGFFVNLLVMRNRLDPSTRFSDFLKQVNATASAAYDHQDIPFDHLVDVLGVKRDASTTPLFQVLFVLTQGNADMQQALPGVDVSAFHHDQGIARYALTLRVNDFGEGSGLFCQFEYDSDVFAHGTIEDMLTHYQTLCSTAVASPSTALGDFQLVEASAVEASLDSSAHQEQTSVAKIKGALNVQGVHQLVEYQALCEQNANHAALVCENETLTYAELNAQANQLAHHLRAQLLTEDSDTRAPVALYMERSTSLIIGLLAVLKAGLPYVPLDTKWPKQRISALLDDAGVKVVLSESCWQAQLGEFELQSVTFLDSDKAIWEALPRTNPKVNVTLDDAAYVIFTSGSTGTPKGVVVTHGNIVNYTLGVLARLTQADEALTLASLNEISRQSLGQHFGHISTIAADLGNTVLYGALCSGGCLHMITTERAFDPDAVAQYMHTNHVDVLKIVPSHLQGLLSAQDAAHILPKKVLVLGGEACSNALIQRIQALSPTLRIVNHYGPSEATVGVLTHELTPVQGNASTSVQGDKRAPAQVFTQSRIPLGKPLANTQTWVLDAQGHVCPIAVAGELYIGGDSVAKGYLNREDMTAERFVPNPFSQTHHGRLYRTGDRVKRLANGDLEFIGRMDKQVKVRGYRVELGDIEASIKQLEGVSDAFVMLADSGVSAQLVAFVVSAMPREHIIEALTHTLPEYMVPQRVALLEALPLTPNGKVDTRTLQEKGQQLVVEETSSSSNNTQSKRAPTNEKESKLVEVIQQVLRHDDVGLDDNFFELGGDSILSLQVIARAKRQGLKLNPKQFIQQPTIGHLAEAASLIEDKSKSGAASTNNTQPGAQGQDPAEISIPLLPIQQWFFDTPHPQPHYWNQSMLFQSVQPLQVEALKKAVAAVVQQHEQLRCEFVSEAGKNTPIQRVTPWHPQAIEHYFVQDDWQQQNAGNAVDTNNDDFVQVVNEWQSRLSLSAKPLSASKSSGETLVGQLFKVVYFAGGEQAPDRLLLVAHHLLIDGVSWRVLLDDVMHAYQYALQHPQTDSACAALPERTSRYYDWAQGLAALSQQREMDWHQQGREYWHTMAQSLKQSDARLETTSATAKAGYSLSQVTHEHFTLDASITEALLQKAPKAYKTRINDLLLSALVHAYGQQKPGEDVYLELEGHGREHVEGSLAETVDVSRTVGWFTSRFPVLLPAMPSQPCRLENALPHLIKSTKETLSHIPLQGMAYGVLRYLDDMPALPAPAISFNYLGQMDVGGESQGNESAATSLFEAVPGSEAVQDRHGDNVATHFISMNAMIVGGELQIRWSQVKEALKDKVDVNLLGHDFITALKDIVTHCGDSAQGFTPSDFPLAALAQHELDELAQQAQTDVPDIEDVYPMTPMQEGLMFHTLLKPGSGIYVMQYCYELNGHFDQDAFIEAGRLVVAQHPILRTSFWRREQGSMQIVHRHASSPVRYLDWRHLPEQEQEEQLASWLADKLKQGFDMSRPTQLSITLIQVADDKYQLVRSFHHILMDAWCFSLLMNDFMRAYQAVVAKQAPQLSQPRPYRDYIEWLQATDMQKAEAFWRENLSGFNAPTSLGIAAEQTTSGVKDHLTVLSEAQTDRLHHVAKQMHSTVNTLVQGAWALLLSRYSGDKDIIFGVTVAGRPTEMEGADGILGLFINSLPLTVNVDPTASPQAFLKQVWEANHQIREYEFAPLVDIHRWSAFPAGVELFDSLFVFENAPLEYDEDTEAPTFELAGITNRTHTNYPITVVVYPKKTLGLQLTYDCAKFADADVARMLANFRETLLNLTESLAAEIAKEPLTEQAQGRAAEKIGDMAILPVSEQKTLLVDWNQTYTDYPREQCWQSVFNEQVNKTPHAVAVACDGESLTYKALNLRAHYLAKKLLLAGVQPNDVVAVLDNRGLDLMVMMVAVLKAGAGYLPLDPKHPTQRLANVLVSSQPRIVLTGGGFQPQIIDALEHLADEDQSIATHLMSYDEPSEIELSQMRLDKPLPVTYRTSDLAYVIYTSGSTGLPKGAMVEHLGMLNNVYAKIPLLSLTQDDVIAQTASQCFDISVWQCLTGLICGAKVQVYPDAVAHDPNALLAAVERDKVSILESVPSLIQSFVDIAPALSALRWLMPTGEALTSELAQQWLQRYPRIPLMNAYGPAECADDVAMWPIRTVDEAKVEPMPIGKPTDNNRLYVLNDQLAMQPIGVAGELYVAGAGVGRGYLNDPERTQTAFMDNPLRHHDAHDSENLSRWDQPHRLYKTGDIARWREDGVLEYLGRTDHQVKIRGFRIELGEIESVLQHHTGLKDAVVMARSNERGEPMLVAYVVPSEAAIKKDISDPSYPKNHDDSESHDALIEALKLAIKEALPVYMQPAAYSVLESFPLTPNGKVDRKALPDVDFAEQQQTYTAPRNALETQLCEIWQSLLKLERVGIDDNFFELGGHSLLAVRLMTHLEKLGLNLTLPALFQHPTIRELAQSTGVEATSVLHPLKVGVNPPANTAHTEAPAPVFCIHHGGGHTRQYQALAKQLPDNVAVYGIQARSLLDSSYEETALAQMAQDYVSLIQEVQPQGPYRLIGWSIGGVLAVEIAHLLEQQNQTVSFIGLIDSTLPASLSLKPSSSSPDLPSSALSDMSVSASSGMSVSASPMTESQNSAPPRHVVDELLGLIDAKKQALYHALPEQVRMDIEHQVSQLPTSEAVSFAVNWAVENGILPDSIDKHYLSLSGQTLLRYRALWQAHQPRHIHARVHVCWAQDSLIPVTEAEAQVGATAEFNVANKAAEAELLSTESGVFAAPCRWANVTGGIAKSTVYPGGHFDVIENPTLLEDITRWLA